MCKRNVLLRSCCVADSRHVHVTSSVSMFVLLSARPRADVKANLNRGQWRAERTKIAQQLMSTGEGLSQRMHHFDSITLLNVTDKWQPERNAASKKTN